LNLAWLDDRFVPPAPPIRQHFRIATTLPLAECAARLSDAVRKRAAIEGSRRWPFGTQRCIAGEVRGDDVELNVEARYVGRVYDRNSWKTAFLGRLDTREKHTVLEGTFDLRYLSGADQLWLLRPFGAVITVAAIVIGLQGVFGGRPESVCGFGLAVPGIALILGAPWAVYYVKQGAADDGRLLRSFLADLLESDGGSTISD
jgi:hypothetical protein